MTISKKIIPFLFFFFSFSVGIFFFTADQARAEEIVAPLILRSEIERSREVFGNVLIVGLTQSESEVLVYIDEKLAGMAQVNTKRTDTDNFYFRTEEPLEIGVHEIMILARDKSSSILSEPSISKLEVTSLPAPTLVEPGAGNIMGTDIRVITGLTVNNTFVHIYIDDAYDGKTEIVRHQSGTADFNYAPSRVLSEGIHQVRAVAEDELGRRSSSSRVLTFSVNYPMPAPIILEPKVQSYNQIFVLGLAKNNSLIKIFVNEKLESQFQVENDESGTANFAYKLDKLSANGIHLVYATATDPAGKESKWSNIIYFDITEPEAVEPPLVVTDDTLDNRIIDQVEDEGAAEILAPEVAEDDEEVGVLAAEENLPSDEDTAALEDENQEPEINVSQIEEGNTIIPVLPEEGQESVQVRDQILEPDIVEVKNEAGEIISTSEAAEDLKDAKEDEAELLAEDKEDEGKDSSPYRFLIFSAFLVAIIAWIIWVNKELIKERKEQKAEDKASGTQPNATSADSQDKPLDSSNSQNK